MQKLLAFAICAALLSGCDFVGGSGDPVAFSSVTLTTAPLPADEDGTAPDLYVEVQDAGGRAVYKGQTIMNADASAFPYVVATNGELTGSKHGYFIVVMDQNADGYEFIAATGPFTADQLRSSTEPVFEVSGSEGEVRAEIAVSSR
jgi:hypothetical protein